MRFIGSLSLLVTVMIAALITMHPVAARAAEQQIEVHRELAAEPAHPLLGCPLTRPGAGSDCDGGAKGQVLITSAAVHQEKHQPQEPRQANDASGALLEDLVKKGPGR